MLSDWGCLDFIQRRGWNALPDVLFAVILLMAPGPLPPMYCRTSAASANVRNRRPSQRGSRRLPPLPPSNYSGNCNLEIRLKSPIRPP